MIPSVHNPLLNKFHDKIPFNHNNLVKKFQPIVDITRGCYVPGDFIKFDGFGEWGLKIYRIMLLEPSVFPDMNFIEDTFECDEISKLSDNYFDNDICGWETPFCSISNDSRDIKIIIPEMKDDEEFIAYSINNTHHHKSYVIIYEHNLKLDEDKKIEPHYVLYYIDCLYS